MKLNLLPTTVSREKTARRAWVFTIFLSLISLALAIFMIITSKAALEDAKARALEIKPKAEQAATTAASADTEVADAAPFLRNVALVKAMDDHTDVYPDFYKKLLPSIPDFFRVTSIQVNTLDANTASVTMNGVIKNQRLYNELLFALLRIPGVTAVNRSPIPSDVVVVPNLTPQDLIGKPRKQSEGTIPDDPDARLNYYLARGGVTSYQNVSNFGSGSEEPRGAMPTYNAVAVTFNMPAKLQVPNIRDALAQAGSAPAGGGAPAAATPAATGFGKPGGGAAASPAGAKGGDSPGSG